ncbi:M14 family metallopeptidase [Acidobacteriota bacterium]
MRKTKILYLVTGLAFLSLFILADPPKPEKALGFKIGTAKKVADMHQIVDYFKVLGRESGRITLKEIGQTTMGNPFIVAIITSEENQKNLEKYRKYQQMLADPRQVSDKEAGKIISEGKAVVMINCSLHASEIGASQMSMQLAYDLATRNSKKIREILDNVILLLTPMHNPDGTQMVVDWYKKNLGTDYEGGRMPWLYHKYVGHDNNRDWYMFTQAETRLTILVHNEWHPQAILDMHQMGNRRARIFVPPFVDPYEPNIDPILRQEVAMMGTFMATELTAEGKAGVIHSSGYDAWTPARAYHHYHGGIRILTEVASVKLATPVTIEFEDLSDEVKEPSVRMPMPWKGGDWTLKDIVDYDYSAAMAVLINAARLRENWLNNFYKIHKNAVAPKENPYAFVIPSEQRDLSTAVKMMNILQIGDVEIHKADASFLADGRQYEKGTYIVYVSQPYGGFGKTLLERQVYPEIREYPGAPLKTPYDTVGHTLPLLMGVEAIQIQKPFKVKATKLDKISKPAGKVEAGEDVFGFAWGYATNDDVVALNRLLKKGYKAFWPSEKFEANGKTFSPGTMIVRNKQGLANELQSMVKDLYARFEPLKTGPSVKILELKQARLGLYKPWTASMDEGWTRWVIEQYEFPYKSILDKDIRRGDLGQEIDVLLLADLSDESIVNGASEESVPPEYAGGIGEIGVKNIKEFIQNGGTLITLNSAAEFPINRFYLTIVNKVENVDRKNFFIPGSILKVLNKTDHPIAYGYERDAAIFFRRSPVFAVMEGRSVVKYPMQNPLLSGWVNGENYLYDRSAIVDVPFGEGKIILIGFPVLYRAQSHATFRYLFNSILYGAAEPGKLE